MVVQHVLPHRPQYLVSVYRESGSKTDLPVIPFPVPIHDSKVDEDSK